MNPNIPGWVLWMEAWKLYHPREPLPESIQVRREAIPPFPDWLDELLAIWIAQSMLDEEEE